MKKATILTAALAAFVGLAFILPHCGKRIFEHERAEPFDVHRAPKLFGDVLEKARSDYVETPNDNKMVEAAISGLLASLDPNSSYITQQTFADMPVQINGHLGYLGLDVMQENGMTKVVSLIDDAPAARAGILSGDVITAIDGEVVQGMTIFRVLDKFRGAVNSKVKLTLARGSEKDRLEVTLTREIIRIKSVRSRVEGADVGYLRIAQFTGQTCDDLKDAMKKIQSDIPAETFKGYVLDLRNNPGGLLDQSVAVVNAFIDGGEIVSMRSRNADESRRYDARAMDLSKGKPVVVLINGGTASVAEIVAGALQYHKRATLIGARTSGKGSVQTILPLGQNHGALRLTTARYIMPSGRPIDDGIKPDIEVAAGGNDADAQLDAAMALLRGS